VLQVYFEEFENKTYNKISWTPEIIFLYSSSRTFASHSTHYSLLLDAISTQFSVVKYVPALQSLSSDCSTPTRLEFFQPWILLRAFWLPVLSSAEIGLIFARSGESTQPGQLMQTSQTNGVFNMMWLHAQYLNGRASQERVNDARGKAGHWAKRKFHCIFFLLILL